MLFKTNKQLTKHSGNHVNCVHHSSQRDNLKDISNPPIPHGWGILVCVKTYPD